MRKSLCPKAKASNLAVDIFNDPDFRKRSNIIEQDHRFVKKRVRAAMGYRSFDTAERTIQGVEAVNMMRKGQVKGLDRSNAASQAKFVESLFEIAA